MGVLWQLLRLRQACNHPLLVKGAGGLAPQQPVPAAEVRAGQRGGGCRGKGRCAQSANAAALPCGLPLCQRRLG